MQLKCSGKNCGAPVDRFDHSPECIKETEESDAAELQAMIEEAGCKTLAEFKRAYINDRDEYPYH